MISLFNSLINIFQIFLTMSISAIVIFAVILMVKSVFGRRISLKNHVLVWVVFAAVLMIPVSLIDASLPDWSTPAKHIWEPVNKMVAPLKADPIPDNVIVQEPDSSEKAALTSNPSSNEPAPSNQAVQNNNLLARLDISQIIWLMLSLVWLTGVLIMFSVYTFSYARTLRSVTKQGQTPGKSWQDCLDNLSRRIGVKHPVELRLLAGVHGPFVFGVRQCRIVLPAELINQLDDTAIKTILIHELIHLKHRDHWIRLLQCLILSIHWFNPVVWLAFNWQQRDSEYFCDESTVLLSQNQNRSSYAKVLLTTAALPSNAQEQPDLPDSLLSPSFIEVNLHKRIRKVLHKRKVSAVVALSAVLVVVLAGCTLIPGMTAKPTTVMETIAPTESTISPGNPSTLSLEDFQFDLPSGLIEAASSDWGENKAKVFLSTGNIWDQTQGWNTAGGLILLDLQGLEDFISISGDLIEDVSIWVNHASIKSNATYFSRDLGFVMNTVIFEASFDNYTAAEIADAQVSGNPIPTDELTTEHWFAMMTDGNDTTVFVFYLNAAIYDLYDMISLAQSVEVKEVTPTPDVSVPTIELTLPTGVENRIIYQAIDLDAVNLVDLNGDGIDERIYSTPTTTDTKSDIHINDLTIARSFYFSNRVYLVNLDASDPYIDLVFENAGEYHGSGTYTFYFYDGQSLIDRGTISSASNDGYGIKADNQITSTVFDGQGGISTRTRSSSLCTWFLEEHWQINSEGVLALVPEYYSLANYGGTYPDIGEPEVTLLMDLPLYNNPSSGEPEWTAQKGSVARLVQSDNKQWVQIRLENNDLAWFKLYTYDGEDFAGFIQIESDILNAGDVLEGLLNAG